jgi:anaerobic selenocysteine-containing dehydrogenase
MNHLGRALTTASPPVSVLFVYNCNPLSTLPNQQLVRVGLGREDLFTIVFDQVLTDTARYADLLLPATTFLEHHDYRAGYGYSEFRHVSPVIDRVGQSRPNYEVFAELCQRMGVSRPGDATEREDWLQTLLGNGESAQRIRSELETTGTARLPVGTRPIQFVDVFPGTPDGKIRLCPESLDREAPEGLYQYVRRHRDPQYPLQMISPSTEHRINSTFGQLSRQMAAVELHPVDAEPRSIREGDLVRAYNELGEVICAAHVTNETRSGVVVLPKGLWSHHTHNGQTSNALAPDELTDIAGGACFNDTWVEIERAGL